MTGEAAPPGPPAQPITGLVRRPTGITRRSESRSFELPPVPHSPYTPALPPHPGWTSFASQRHARDLALDPSRAAIWLATWGGVLCWLPGAGQVIRHTSAQGLAGNATRCLALDAGGAVWAAGEEGGICRLGPEPDAPWQAHPALAGWRVSHLVPRLPQGVYACLYGQEGFALGEITWPEAGASGFLLRLHNQLACREVAALLADPANSGLWLANAWGLHYWQAGEELQTFSLPEGRALSLAPTGDGSLWVGASLGLYRFDPNSEPHFTGQNAAPNEDILALAAGENPGQVWVSTMRGIGLLSGEDWQEVRGPARGPFYRLAGIDSPGDLAHAPFSNVQALAAGPGGLYALRPGEGLLSPTCLPALPPSASAEDALSNLVETVRAAGDEVWAGAAGGLFHYQDRVWQAVEPDLAALRDVRSLAAGHAGGETGHLWAAAWPGGLRRLVLGVYLPGRVLDQPLVALVADPAGGMWAASAEEVFRLEPGALAWAPVEPPARSAIGARSIHCLAVTASELYVGTQRGLFRYPPALGLWLEISELKDTAVTALAIHPGTIQVWAGTPQGLFAGPDWQASPQPVDVLSLAFSPGGGPVQPGQNLWVGTASGLERWSPGEMRLLERFTPASSGLAAQRVLCLDVSPSAQGETVWAGTPAGLSGYAWQEKS